MIMRPWFPLIRIAIVAVVIGLWQLAVNHGVVNRLSVSSPSDTYRQLHTWASDGILWNAIADTMFVLVLGYTIGLAAGVLLGTAMGASATARGLLEPFVVFLNAVPRLILIPFFIVWFGFGPTPRILIVVLVIVFFVAITVQTSIEGIQSDYIENVIMLGGRRWDLVRDVYLPGVGIWIISSARVSMGLAFQAAVVAEFFGSSSGLGYLVAQGEQTFATRQIYAALAVTVVLAWILDVGLSLVDRWAGRWVPAAA
jgi:ABC-type nitrate/sulfonate/bicarbonate transport system permease component